MELQEIQGELIVVDNNSTDLTSEVARAKGADRIVFEPMNQISRARNAGAAIARGRYLIFVDADTRIEPLLLSKALRFLEGGYSGGGAALEFEGEISLVGRIAMRVWNFISQSTDVAAGSFVFCQSSGFRSIGGFSQKLYAGEEIVFRED